MTKARIKKIQEYARKNNIKLQKDFPGSTRVKLGVLNDGTLKPQSFLTNYGFLFNIGGFKPKSKREPTEKEKEQWKKAKKKKGNIELGPRGVYNDKKK